MLKSPLGFLNSDKQHYHGEQEHLPHLSITAQRNDSVWPHHQEHGANTKTSSVGRKKTPSPTETTAAPMLYSKQQEHSAITLNDAVRSA